LRLLVYGGWFGSRNLGDDAILMGLRDLMREAIPGAELLALSTDPEYTRRVCGVEATRLFSPLEVLKGSLASYLEAFCRADLCVLSGGTPLYDYGHVSRGLLLGLPRLLGKGLVLFGVGAKSITSLGGRTLTRLLLRGAARISVRDHPSGRVLEGLLGEPVRVTGDSALFLEPAPRERALALLSGVGVDLERPMAAICPRALSKEYRIHYHDRVAPKRIPGMRAELAWAADRLSREGFEVVFLPMHRVPPDDDRAEIETIIRLMREGGPKVVGAELSPDEAMAVLGCMEVVLGLRLHSLIFAACQGVPAVSVGYDSKIGGFMEQAGAGEYVCDPADLPGGLIDAVERALSRKEVLGGILVYNCGRMRRRVREEAEAVASLVGG